MRDNLGNWDAEEAGLTLHELGDLIPRAVWLDGFSVRREYPVGKGKRNSWRIAWGLAMREETLMASKIEGRNVGIELLQETARQRAV